MIAAITSQSHHLSERDFKRDAPKLAPFDAVSSLQ